MGAGRGAVGVVGGLLLALGTAAPARGAIVNETPKSVFYSYTAAPGEQNRLTVTATPDLHIVLRDPGAPVTVAPGTDDCVALDPHTARCGPVGAPDLKVELGDGDDTMTVTGTSAAVPGVTADAGPGNDTIATSTGDDTLAGGEGDDVLSGGGGTFNYLDGGPGADTLHGGAAEDFLAGGPGPDRVSGGAGDDSFYDADIAPGHPRPARDVYDGGPGTDRISYGSGQSLIPGALARRQPLRIDLAAGVGGDRRAGERDSLIGLEDVTGGLGSDVILGNGAANQLDDGRGPHDRIHGRGGSDTIDVSGNDDAYGEAGNDTIETSGAGVPFVSCAGGADDVELHGPRGLPAGAGIPGPLIARDCERTTWFYESVGDEGSSLDTRNPPRPSAISRGGVLTFRLPCLDGHCRAGLTRPHGRRARLGATRAYTVPARSRRLARVRLRLPAAFVRAHRHRLVELRVDVRGTPDGAEVTFEHAWRIRVRLP